MATILTKRSNTASSVPVAGDLTNSTGGAELAVNTADKRLFTKDSGGTVVELGTNPSTFSLPNGTANGVPYLNGSKVLTSGSALTFDGTNLSLIESNGAGAKSILMQGGASAGDYGIISIANGSTIRGRLVADAGTDAFIFDTAGGASTPYVWKIGSGYSEAMRLTSTGLGIGTSSPAALLHLGGSSAAIRLADQTYPAVDYWTIRSSSDIFRLNKQVSGSSNNGDVLLVDQSGNLGLGVTPSAWDSTYKAFQSTTSALASASGDVKLLQNAYYDGGWKYMATQAASMYSQASGAHNWRIAPSGTAGTAISFTQAMTLDASGNLGVGTTSPTAVGGYVSVSANGSTGSLFDSYAGGTLTGRVQASSNAYFITAQGASTTLAFGTVNTERARIDSSGNLLVGTTSNPYSGRIVGYGAPFVSHSTGTTATDKFYFVNGNGIVGYIQTNGSSTSYNTSSDYRLKNTIAPMTGALAKVQALKPCIYKWNADGSDGEGFIAHELAEVCPQAVTGEKDAVDADGNPVYQGIDTSFLVATLTAAIQELKAEVDSLKSEINTLKGI